MIDNSLCVILKLNLSYCIYLMLISMTLLRVWLPVKKIFVILN